MAETEGNTIAEVSDQSCEGLQRATPHSTYDNNNTLNVIFFQHDLVGLSTVGGYICVAVKG